MVQNIALVFFVNILSIYITEYSVISRILKKRRINSSSTKSGKNYLDNYPLHPIGNHPWPIDDYFHTIASNLRITPNLRVIWLYIEIFYFIAKTIYFFSQTFITFKVSFFLSEVTANRLTIQYWKWFFELIPSDKTVLTKNFLLERIALFT